MDWENYMNIALELGHQAGTLGDVPVGAIVVRDSDGAILGRGHNRREADHDATAHAELLAIREACRAVGNWRLTGCTIYVTLEPCPMCTGAILLSRMGRVVFGAFDPLTGCCGSQLSLTDAPFDSHPALYGGVLEQDCKDLLQAFFTERR